MSTPLITLTTDFGLGDYDVGVLHGVLWSICPTARLVDLSHQVARHNILEGALLLERCVPYFPPGSIHVAVVDPGVGTARRPLAARLGEHYFVGPDNGLCTALLRRCRERGEETAFFHLNRPQYWLPEISNVFHGRDIFAPVAAHLANGVPLEALGEPIQDPHQIEIPLPERTSYGWRGAVMHIDHFGNLSTNLEPHHLVGFTAVEIRCCGERIRRLARTFGEGRPGELLAVFDSSGKLCLCVVNGNAATRLGAQVGALVEVHRLDG